MEQYVLIGPSSFGERDRAPLERLSAAGFSVIENPFKRRLERAELIDLLRPDVVGLLAGLEPLDADVLRRSNLRVVSRVGAGMTNIDLDAARTLGIVVHSTPFGPTEAVAELTVGALLSLMRILPQMDSELHAGRWSKRIGVQLEGKTVAIVGYGRIGRRVAELLQPFRVRLLIADPLLSPDAVVPGEVVELESALDQADVVTLHCSGEELLIDRERLARMKRTAFLLNAARGGLVDEAALVNALENGRLAGAWIDTFQSEPYRGPLISCRNVLLTPHVGSYTEECRARMESEAVENLLRGLAESRR